MKTDQSEYLIVVDTASLLQTPPSDQIFLELEFDKKLSNSKLERYIKARISRSAKVALVSMAPNCLAITSGGAREQHAIQIKSGSKVKRYISLKPTKETFSSSSRRYFLAKFSNICRH